MSTKLTKSNIEARVIAVCNAFDKITADKVRLSHFFLFRYQHYLLMRKELAFKLQALP